MMIVIFFSKLNSQKDEYERINRVKLSKKEKTNTLSNNNNINDNYDHFFKDKKNLDVGNSGIKA